MAQSEHVHREMNEISKLKMNNDYISSDNNRKPLWWSALSTGNENNVYSFDVHSVSWDGFSTQTTIWAWIFFIRSLHSSNVCGHKPSINGTNFCIQFIKLSTILTLKKNVYSLGFHVTKHWKESYIIISR